MLSYAGTVLDAPPPSAIAWVRQHLDFAWAPPWRDPDGQPAAGLERLGIGPPMPRGPLEIGVLRWPWGASRWGYVHLIVSDPALDAVRRAVYAGGPPSQQDLAIDDGRAELTTAMWMLPPRPLSQVPDATGFSLVSLADVRYWWWAAAADVKVAPTVTTWADLFADLADALNTTLDVDPVPAAYGAPPADLGASYRALPPLLDAAATSVGMRVVRDFAGNVRVMSPATSRGILDANLALPGLSRRAGGVAVGG